MPDWDQVKTDKDFLSLPPQQKRQVLSGLLDRDTDFGSLPESMKAHTRNQILNQYPDMNSKAVAPKSAVPKYLAPIGSPNDPGAYTGGLKFPQGGNGLSLSVPNAEGQNAPLMAKKLQVQSKSAKPSPRQQADAKRASLEDAARLQFNKTPGVSNSGLPAQQAVNPIDTPEARAANIAQLSGELGITPQEAGTLGVAPAVQRVEDLKRAYQSNQLPGFMGESTGNIEDLLGSSPRLAHPGLQLKQRGIEPPKSNYSLLDTIQPGSNQAIAETPGVLGAVRQLAGGVVDSIPSMMAGGAFAGGGPLAQKLLAAALGLQGLHGAATDPNAGDDPTKTLITLLGNLGLVGIPALLHSGGHANTPTTTAETPSMNLKLKQFPEGQNPVNPAEARMQESEAAKRSAFNPNQPAVPDVPIGTSPTAPEGVPVEKTVPSVATPQVPKTPVETAKVADSISRPASPVTGVEVPADVPETPAQEASPPQRVIAGKNASTEAMREELELPQVDKNKPVGIEEGIVTGRKALEEGTVDPQKLIDEQLTKKPRTLNPEENGALVEYKRQALLKLEATRKALTEAIDSGSPQDAIERLQALRKSHIDAYDSASQALTHSGTAWSEAGQARRGTVEIDTGNVSQVLMEAKHIKGSPLNSIDEARFTQLAEESAKKEATYQARIAQLEKEQAQSMPREMINRASKNTVFTQERYDAAVQRLAEKRKNIGVMADPTGAQSALHLASMLPDLIDIGGYKFEAGLRKFGAWAQSMRDELGGDLDEASLQHVWAGVKGETTTNNIRNKNPFEQPTTFVEALARRIGWEKTGNFTEAITGENGSPVILDKLINGEELTEAEVATVTRAYADNAIERGKKLTPTQAQQAVSDMINMASETKARGMSDAARLKGAITAAQNRIGVLEQAVSEGKRPAKKQTNPVTSPELEKLRARVKELTAQLPEAERTPMTEEARLAGAKRSTQAGTDKLNARLKRIEAGDTSPDTKRPDVVPDRELEDLRRQRDIASFKVKKALAGAEKKTGWDYLLSWQRANILSGVGSLGKIGNASLGRMAASVLDEITGIPFSGTQLAKMAPREGGGLNAKAEVQAFKAGFAKASNTEAVQAVTNATGLTPTFSGKEVVDAMRPSLGENSLDRQFGNKIHPQETVLGFFGRIHGAIKTPAQLNEFYRSLEKRAAFELRNGNDLSDTAVATRVASGAYVDSLRAKFMQDNVAVTAFKSVLRTIEAKGGKGGVIASKLIRSELPIVKIPTNFIGEVGQYAAGAPYGVVKTVLAGGVKKLSPEGADAVLRAYKKQGVGAALFALGYMGAIKAGGYYVRGEKEQGVGDLHPGDLQIFGVNVPHTLAHIPALEAIQIGATAAKAIASGKGIGEAIRRIGVGMAEQVPFYGEAVRSSEATKSTESLGKFAGSRAAAYTEPRLLQELAAARDKDSQGKQIQRAPQGFGDVMKMGVPGLRQQVETKSGLAFRKKFENSIKPKFNLGLKGLPK